MGAPQNADPQLANGQPPVMLVLGDSVMWGQGLEDGNKFSSLAFDQLSSKYPGLQGPVMLAHSGAVIGAGIHSTWPTLPGEIPASGPTIFDQCNQYADPSPVRVILMDGGINDVDVRVLLSPMTAAPDLSALIKQHCYADMKQLLQTVAVKFSDPGCRIVLLGYYPILGENSDKPSIPFLLKARGIPHADLLLASDAAISDPRDLAVQFWKESDQWLSQAAAEVNKTQAGNNRITYILPPFQEQNALFESDPWLWGLDFGSGLAPEDEVADQRRDECVLRVPRLLDCQECIRASVGHPNATGAIKYYEAVMSAFP
jgi:hypothetical protein